MATTKRYYWLKLKEDFFDDTYVKMLRTLPQGDSLIIVYLKMQLKSLKNEGLLRYCNILPDSISELSIALGENENIVRLTVEALIRCGVVERWEDETFYMVAMQELIGSETDVARRVQKHRTLQSNIKALHCNTPETKCNTEKEIEKEIELKLDQESTGAEQAPLPSPAQRPEKEPAKKYGEYGWVRLTNTEHAKLVDELGLAETERCISYIDESAQGNGNKNRWKDWNLVIRRCHREGWGLAKYGGQRQQESSNPFLAMLEKEAF